MSELKVGDRVKVELEGEVSALADTDGDYAIQGEFGEIYIAPQHLTKISPPLPTADGSVVYITPMTYQRVDFDWFMAGSTKCFSKQELQNLANEHGFTVLYAGDDV